MELIEKPIPNKFHCALAATCQKRKLNEKAQVFPPLVLRKVQSISWNPHSSPTSNKHRNPKPAFPCSLQPFSDLYGEPHEVQKREWGGLKYVSSQTSKHGFRLVITPCNNKESQPSELQLHTALIYQR